MKISTILIKEFRVEAEAWIRGLLGYVPGEHILLGQISFIQALINDQKAGRVDPNSFHSQMILHVKHIRNIDMRKGGWITRKEHNEFDLDRYEAYLPERKIFARYRLCKVLGYEPELAHSLEAEVYLRQAVDASNDLSSPFRETDYKAATITMYRSHYCRDGIEAARNSDLTLLNIGVAFGDT